MNLLPCRRALFGALLFGALASARGQIVLANYSTAVLSFANGSGSVDILEFWGLDADGDIFFQQTVVIPIRAT